MKKFFALLASSLLFVTAVKADDWITWPTFALRDYTEGHAGVPAVFVVGGTNVLGVLAAMSNPTYDVMSAGTGGVFDIDTFLAYSDIGLIASGTPAMMVKLDGVGMTDYYGNYNIIYGVYQGVYSATNFYYDTTQTSEWTQHCSGGNPTFANYMNVLRVDALPAGVTLVNAECQNAGGWTSCKYAPGSSTLYILNQYSGGVLVPYDPTTLNSVQYVVGTIPMSTSHRWEQIDGKTDFSGSYFGWLITDSNPTTFTGD